MTNPYEHHDLAAELPEYKDQIHRLKMSDAHFEKKAAEYEKLCKEIANIELGFEFTSDEYIESKKKARAQLKDTIFALLQKAA